MMRSADGSPRHARTLRTSPGWRATLRGATSAPDRALPAPVAGSCDPGAVPRIAAGYFGIAPAAREFDGAGQRPASVRVRAELHIDAGREAAAATARSRGHRGLIHSHEQIAWSSRSVMSRLSGTSFLDTSHD